MTGNTERAAGIPAFAMVAIMLAVFTVSVGYGVVLPLLPRLIERLLGAGVEAATVSRHTGLLTAVYTLSLFLGAPLWGRLSDRRGPRGVLLLGLIGFGMTMLIFSLVESLAAAYAERLLSGVFAAAVTPVAAAAVGNFTTTEQGRARRLAFVSMAGITGLMLGPMLGVLIERIAAGYFIIVTPPAALTFPLAATGMLAFLAASAVAPAVSSGHGQSRAPETKSALTSRTAWLVPKLLILTFIVSAGIGSFEVGIALRGKLDLGLAPFQVALMFAECGLIMFVMQAIVFSPRFKPATTRWLIAPALAVLGGALFLVPWAPDFAVMLVVVGAVAASAGILSPILTYWISVWAGTAQGWELGKQTAASSLGMTSGSAAGGLLFDVAALPGASFVLSALLVVLGSVLSLKLPHLLASRNREFSVVTSEAH